MAKRKRSRTSSKRNSAAKRSGEKNTAESAGNAKLPSQLRASPSAAFEHHLFTLFSSLGRLARAPLSTLMTMGVIAIALALPAAFYLTLKAAGDLSVGFSAVGEISVFLRAGTDEATANKLQQRSGTFDGVAESYLIDPTSALIEFEQHSDLGEAVAALGENPLPWVLVIRPVSEDAVAANALKERLEREPLVDHVQIDMEWLSRFSAMIGVGQRAIQLIGLLLAIGVLLIVGNTVRLDIENRREEIEVTKMLGGSDGFVRRPFLYSGFWYGVGGGLLAVIVIFVGLASLGGAIDDLVDAYGSGYRFAGLDLLTAGRLLLLAGITGWLGSWLAVSRHLASINPR